jgi:hypothetical protein
MKKLLPPVLFFFTIALMGVFLAYKHYHQPPAPSSASVDILQKKQQAQNALTFINTQKAEIAAKKDKTAEDQKTIDTLERSAKELNDELLLLDRIYSFANDNFVNLSAVVQTPDKAKVLETFMPMVVTAFLGLVAVFLLIWRKEDADAQKWVYSTFGAILGYWLKGGA